MEVYKKINNNVALARDAKGRELVVFGKGIGFASMPYELTDLSRIQRTFYDVNEKYFALLRDVPEAVFLAADDIADTAREELDCTLNANLTYALADHLNFAIQRSREGLNVQVPLAYDIQLNKESFSYSRFCMHLRYLVQRMMHGSPLDAGNAMDSIFVTMRNEYPQVYACVQQIDTFLHGTYGWQCSKEEQLYLIMHIHRVCVERAED